MTPTQVTTLSAVEIVPGEMDINGYTRATKNTPAATIVAAWISALTGVGPSMASGSQTCSGTWPDLPIAPQKIRIGMAETAVRPGITVEIQARCARAAISRQPRPES